MAMKLRCSRCRKAWIDVQVGRCDSCGLVLGQDALVVANPFGTGAAMDTDSAEEVALDEEIAAARPAAPLTITGITGAGSLHHHGVPERVGGVAAAQSAGLKPFEGYLLSLVDGATFVDDIIAASGLALHEAAIALQNLKLKGLIRFREQVDQSAALRTLDGRVLEPEAPSVVPVSRDVGRMGITKMALGASTPTQEDPTEQIGLARTEAALGNFARAREHARLAAMIAPTNADATQLLDQLESLPHAKTRAKHLHQLGSAAQKTGDNMKAVEFFRGAIQEWEPSAVIHHKLAVALALAGFPMTEAEKHLVRAVELAPTNQTYVEHLGQLRAQLRSGGRA